MKIKFSDESLSDLRNIEEYLLEHWSDKILDDFLTKLDEIVEIICDEKVVFQKFRGKIRRQSEKFSLVRFFIRRILYDK